MVRDIGIVDLWKLIDLLLWEQIKKTWYFETDVSCLYDIRMFTVFNLVPEIV
jgi:hypothetical protein